MKKKFKLFATIGSLCLAVAMMTIGVLAATSATLNVTSTVQFSAVGVYVDVAGKVEGGDLAAAKELTAKNYTELTGQSSSDFTGTGLTNSKWALGALNFVENTDENTDGQTITYTFTFTNKSDFDIKVTPTVTKAETFPATITVTETKTGMDSIAKNGSVTYTLVLELTDVSATIAAQQVDLKFVAEKA